MVPKLKFLLFVCLPLFAFVPTIQAQALPRILYVSPEYDNSGNQMPSFLGKYWSLGIAFTGFEGGLSGPSIRYGFGDTGKKLSLSYIMGSSLISLEAGVAYMKQDADASIWVNDKRKGYALEGALRYNIFSVIGVATKTDRTLEFGLGF